MVRKAVLILALAGALVGLVAQPASAGYYGTKNFKVGSETWTSTGQMEDYAGTTQDVYYIGACKLSSNSCPTTGSATYVFHFVGSTGNYICSWTETHSNGATHSCKGNVYYATLQVTHSGHTGTVRYDY